MLMPLNHEGGPGERGREGGREREVYSVTVVLLFDFQLDIFPSGTHIDRTQKHPQKAACVSHHIISYEDICYRNISSIPRPTILVLERKKKLKNNQGK